MIEQTVTPSKRRVWVVSELYYPELTSTGYFMTGIAEGLSDEYSTLVLCGQPSYWSRGVKSAKHEIRNGVRIYRCPGTTFDKNRLVFKLLNLITLSLSIFLSALHRLRRGDIVIAVTNPPAMPYLVALACWARGCQFILVVHDVYPDILVRLNIFKANSVAIIAMRRVASWLYSRCRRIIVIGRDMQELLLRHTGFAPERVVIATNWADTTMVAPQTRSTNPLLQRLGLEDKFVVQLWGNMGYAHCVEDIVNAAERLSGHLHIHFLIIGWGARKAWAASEVRSRGLENVTLLDPFPREQSRIIQNACDVALNTLASGMEGISVPSRSYNAMAAGKPLVVVCANSSEVAAMIREESIGWTIPPGRPDLLADALLEAASDKNRLANMGLNALRAVREKYSKECILGIYKHTLASVDCE